MALTGIQLRCPLEKCDALTVTASGTKTSGLLEKVQNTVGVWATAVATGAAGALLYKIPAIVLPCAAAPTAGYAVGAKLYYDAADAELNASADGNTLCAIVRVAADAGDETVEVAFDGTLGIVS